MKKKLKIEDGQIILVQVGLLFLLVLTIFSLKNIIKKGTIFEPEEIEKKKIAYSNQIAKDHKNHKRFTGAFTGGFSAGYFNTVGSKEGWKPTQFVSSKGIIIYIFLILRK